MSVPDDRHVLLSEAELTALGVQALRGLGLSPGDAQEACRVLVLADLCLG